jgi:hypothetical protein
MKALLRAAFLVLVASSGPLAVGAVSAAEQPRRSKLCPEDLPEGVRLPPQPGCGAGPLETRPRRPGSFDLGDGTTVQIGGRASTAFGVRR